MESIQLDHLLPHVFRSREDLKSDVWQQSLTLERGKAYLIEADSGTGKSSLCSYIIGYRTDFDGKLSFDNRDIRKIRNSEWVEIRQRQLSHLFQELRLFPELTAYENVEIKNNLTRHKSRQWIEQAFERLGIAEKLGQKLGKMSFGQQQRVALIRSLVQPFSFILADEPVSHLDERNAKMMSELLLEEARSQGAGIVVTSIGKQLPMNYDRVLHL